jgi:hypothetical protein
MAATTQPVHEFEYFKEDIKNKGKREDQVELENRNETEEITEATPEMLVKKYLSDLLR